MPWFELKTLEGFSGAELVSRPSESKMFEAADAEQAKREARDRTRDLKDGCVALLLDRNGRQLASFRAQEPTPEPVARMHSAQVAARP